MSWDYFWRGVQVAGGVGEVIGGGVMAGVGALGAPVTGGVSLGATIGGAAIGAHGLDQIQAGLRGVPSVASQLGGSAASAVFGPEYAWIGSMAGDIGPGFGGIARTIKNLPALLAHLSEAAGPALAKAVSILREEGALTQILQKMNPAKLKEWLKAKIISEEELRKAGINPDELDSGKKVSKAPVEPKPPTAQEQAEALPGHGHDRHGSQVTDAEQTTSVQTGLRPDGEITKKPGRATTFDSPEAEIDAVNRGQDVMSQRETAGTSPPNVITVDPNGVARLPRDAATVTGYPNGYGAGVEVVRDANGNPLPGRPVQPTGQMPNATVVFEKDPLTGAWKPVTHFPDNKPVTRPSAVGSENSIQAGF